MAKKVIEHRGPRSEKLVKFNLKRQQGTNEKVAVILGIVIFCLAIFVAIIGVNFNYENSLSGMAVARGARSEPAKPVDLTGVNDARICNTARPVDKIRGIPQMARIEMTTFKRNTLDLDKSLCKTTSNFFGLKSCKIVDSVRAQIMCELNKSKRTGGCYFATIRDGPTKGTTFCAYATLAK